MSASGKGLQMKILCLEILIYLFVSGAEGKDVWLVIGGPGDSNVGVCAKGLDLIPLFATDKKASARKATGKVYLDKLWHGSQEKIRCYDSTWCASMLRFWLLAQMMANLTMGGTTGGGAARDAIAAGRTEGGRQCKICTHGGLHDRQTAGFCANQQQH